MDIRSDRQKGLSYVELGKKYHIDPRTAKRYAESPQKPEYTLSEPKPTKMDPYKQIVDEWLEEAPYSALRILEKLREMGFNGGYSIVKAYVSSRKMDLNEKATVRFETIVPFPVSWTVKMKKKQKETQDILSYHTQAAGCSDKARAKASGGRQPIEECGRTGL